MFSVFIVDGGVTTWASNHDTIESARESLAAYRDTADFGFIVPVVEFSDFDGERE